MRWFLALVGAVLAVVAVVAWTAADAPTTPRARFANHVWIDRMPKDARDRIQILVAAREGRRTWGAAEIASRFSVRAEAFTFRRHERALELMFLQDRVKVRLKTKVWRCEGEAPAPFQLCLELRADGRRRVLYSRDDWTPGQLATLPIPVAPPIDAGDRCDDCVEVDAARVLDPRR